MLQDSVLRSNILEFARQNYQDEGLLFWLAIQVFEGTPDDKRLPMAK
jgi:hypothetical protein